MSTRSNVYHDLASGGRDDPASTAACGALRKDDVLVVWKLDRLGRNLAHLVNTVHDLAARGVDLRVLAGQGTQVDTTTAGGPPRVRHLRALAEFERELIRERTVAGLDAARARGQKWRCRRTPVTMRQVRESLTHLFSLGEFVDVRASAAAVAQGVSLRYDLVPFRGAGGMEVHDPRGRPVEEEAALVRRRLGGPGVARLGRPARGRRRRTAGSSSTSTRARRRGSGASRFAGSSPPAARSPEPARARASPTPPCRARTRSAASSSWASRRPPSRSSRACPGPLSTAS